MSNNAHELSNRLLNALDNNYNVSFRLLMIVRWINESRYEYGPRAHDTRFEVAIWPLGRLSPESPSPCYHWEVKFKPFLYESWSRVRVTKRKFYVWIASVGARRGTDVVSAAPRPSRASLVPKILQCESMELCHAWPLLYNVDYCATDWGKNGLFCVQRPTVSMDSLVWYGWHVGAASILSHYGGTGCVHIHLNWLCYCGVASCDCSQH